LSAPAPEPDTLSAAALRRGLRTRLVGRRIDVHERVTSTNDVAWELAGLGAEDGAVVVAEEQTGGRGRLGRTWWSPRGKGLWLSVLLRPPTRAGAVPMTTIVGALAAADAIRDVTRLRAMIRWPNDVLIDGRKVAGVLVEARQGARGRDLVLGIGLDVNVRRAEMPDDFADAATSLSEELGEPVSRTALARQVLRELDRWYQIKLDGDTEAINRRWRELSATLGRRIELKEQERRYRGEVIEVDVSLGLALRLDSGGIRHFRGEHVSRVRHI